MFIIVILIYLIIGLLEILPLIRQKQKKELIIYSVLFSGAFIMSLLLSFGIELPSPAGPIETVVKAIIRK